MDRFKRVLMNDKGSSILGYLIVVSVTVAIAIQVIPYFNSVAKIRNEKIINVFNSTDTIVSVE
jgi:hypothetical protein